MKEGIKVQWRDNVYITSPEVYNSNPTKEDIKAYYEALKNASIKHQGKVIKIIHSFFGGTKAVIEGTDNKFYIIKLYRLKVIKDYD